MGRSSGMRNMPTSPKSAQKVSKSLRKSSKVAQSLPKWCTLEYYNLPDLQRHGASVWGTKYLFSTTRLCKIHFFSSCGKKISISGDQVRKKNHRISMAAAFWLIFFKIKIHIHTSVCKAHTLKRTHVLCFYIYVTCTFSHYTSKFFWGWATIFEKN